MHMIIYLFIFELLLFVISNDLKYIIVKDHNKSVIEYLNFILLVILQFRPYSSLFHFHLIYPNLFIYIFRKRKVYIVVELSKYI